jgi:hypothetical protein
LQGFLLLLFINALADLLVHFQQLIGQALAPAAEVGVTNALLLAELHGRQAAVLLPINQGLPLF